MVSKAERLQKQLEISTARANSAKAALADLRRVQNLKARKEARKKRSHALLESVGLMILANLIDSESGLPKIDRGGLLGGLLAVAKTLEYGPESTRFQEWKSTGDALLAEREAARQSPPAKSPATAPDPTSSESAVL